MQEEIKKQQEDNGDIVKEYQEHLDSLRKKLERNTPSYKILQEKRAELKRCQVEILEMQHKIRDRKQINKQKTDISKQIFYGKIVSFAKAWIDRRNFLEASKKLTELTSLEIQCVEKTTSNSNANLFIPQLEVRC